MYPLVPLEKIAQINPRDKDWTRLQDTTEVSFVPMQAVSEETAAIERQGFRQLSEVRRGYTPFVEDDVLFAKITPCMENGKVAQAIGLRNGIGFGSTEFHVLRASYMVLPSFLYYFVRQHNFREAAKRRMRGAVGQQRVPAEFLQSYKIPLPPLLEQHHIVAILRQADELWQLRIAADKRARDLLPALFQEIFGDQNPEWQRRTFGSVISRLEAGKSIAAKAHPATDGNWGVLKVSAVTYGYFRAEENKELPENIVPIPEFEVRNGDLLISRANTVELVGASALVRNPPEKLLLPDKLWRVVLPQDPEVNLYFLYALLNTPSMRREISRRATGTSSSMKNISQQKFLDIEFRIPPKPLQDRFAETIQHLWDEVIGDQTNVRQKVDALFQSLLAQAFSGDLTAAWREKHADELAQAAVERDRLIDDMPDGGQPSLLDVNTIRPMTLYDLDVESLVVQVSPAVDQLLAHSQPTDELIRSLAQGAFGALSEQMRTAAQIDTSLVDASVFRGVFELPSSVQQSLAANLQPILDAKQALITNMQPIVDIKQTIADYVQPIVDTKQLVARWIEPMRSTLDTIHGFSIGLAEMLARAAEFAMKRPGSDHPRHHFFAEISDEQYRLYLLVSEETSYFTPESISERYTISLESARAGLQLLAAAGFIIPVSLPVSSTDAGTSYVAAFRVADDQDDVRLSDLAALEGSLT